MGADKTTLLKRILSWEANLSETVVLVNEFGDIGIDGALLKDSGSDVIELTSGCICCTLSSDLHQSLTRIWNRFKPRRILIESSGVADPKSIAPVLKEQGLSQLMCGARKFSLAHISRDDLGALTPEASNVSRIPYIMDVDKAKADEILAS